MMRCVFAAGNVKSVPEACRPITLLNWIASAVILRRLWIEVAHFWRKYLIGGFQDEYRFSKSHFLLKKKWGFFFLKETNDRHKVRESHVSGIDSDSCYRGADKSLARPRRKQARKHVRYTRGFNNIETRAVIKFYFLQGKAPKEIKLFWQKH